MVYEALLLFAVAFFAGWIFFFASGGRDATVGWLRHALQIFVLVVFAAYFLWCWLRGGQTLAMRAWRIRLVDVTPRKALLLYRRLHSRFKFDEGHEVEIKGKGRMQVFHLMSRQ